MESWWAAVSCGPFPVAVSAQLSVCPANCGGHPTTLMIPHIQIQHCKYLNIHISFCLVSISKYPNHLTMDGYRCLKRLYWQNSFAHYSLFQWLAFRNIMNEILGDKFSQTELRSWEKAAYPVKALFGKYIILEISILSSSSTQVRFSILNITTQSLFNSSLRNLTDNLVKLVCHFKIGLMYGTSMMLSKIVFQSVKYFVEQTAVLFESGSGNKIDGYSSTLHWPWIFSCRRCSVFPTLWWRENQTLYQIAWARSSSKRWKPDCVVKAILLVSLNIGDKKNWNQFDVWECPFQRKRISHPWY